MPTLGYGEALHRFNVKKYIRIGDVGGEEGGNKKSPEEEETNARPCPGTFLSLRIF